MSPSEYLSEIAIPTLNEFADEPTSRRRGYLAAIAIYHIGDRIAYPGGKKAMHAKLAALASGYQYVQGVCTGAKHSEATSTPYPFAAGADAIRPAHFVLGRTPLGKREAATIEVKSSSGDGTVSLYSCLVQTLTAFAAIAPELKQCDLSLVKRRLRDKRVA